MVLGILLLWWEIICQNLVSLNTLVHDLIYILYYIFHKLNLIFHKLNLFYLNLWRFKFSLVSVLLLVLCSSFSSCTSASSVVKITISHDWPDFQFDRTIFSRNLQKWPIAEWDYLDSEVWQRLIHFAFVNY